MRKHQHEVAVSRARDQRTAWIQTESTSLFAAYGVNAYEEARKRKHSANDLETMRFWSAVKSEVGRRILSNGGHDIVFATLNPLLDRFTESVAPDWQTYLRNRNESAVLTQAIWLAQSDASTSAALAELRERVMTNPVRLVRRTIEKLASCVEQLQTRRQRLLNRINTIVSGISAWPPRNDNALPFPVPAASCEPLPLPYADQ